MLSEQDYSTSVMDGLLGWEPAAPVWHEYTSGIVKYTAFLDFKPMLL